MVVCVGFITLHCRNFDADEFTVLDLVDNPNIPDCSEFRRFSLSWVEDSQATYTLQLDSLSIASSPLEWTQILTASFSQPIPLVHYFVCNVDVLRHPLIQRESLA